MRSNSERLERADGYRGIWYFNQPSDDEYKYKYSGGLGTYCAKHIPLAYYAKEADRTFFCYGGTPKGENHLLHMVSYYDHRTGTVPRPIILMDKRTDDAHDNPVMMLDDDGYVWIFSSAHGVARPSYIYRSCEPYSIDAFELVQETNFSYPQPWYLSGHGFLFLHTKYVEGHRTLRWMTSHDGREWSGSNRLSEIEMGHYQISWRYKDKVGTAFNYHPDQGPNYRTNLYYVETTDFGKTWHNIHGEIVNTPLREVNNGALVRDYKAEGLLVYMKDLNFDARGNPIIMFVTSNGYEAGPKNDPRVWTTAHWNGEEWEIRGHIESNNNYDTGCLHVEADGTWRIIGPTESGPQPYNPGGEMAIWTSGDHGGAWTREGQITEGSTLNHTYARRPVNAHPDFYAFWADGHGRQLSESRLYFCSRSGEVRRLPFVMKEEQTCPEKLH